MIKKETFDFVKDNGFGEFIHPAMMPTNYGEVVTEEAWGKPSYSSGLDLFGKSHESVESNVKATSGEICSIDLEEVFSEIDNNK